MPAAQIPPGLEARAARWRDQVAGKKILLVLDDAAGHEQVRPLLPGTAGSLVLVTSRRRLTALDDATVITLDPMPPAEAAALLARLAARAGIRAADPAVGELARLCGYLPLAIGMLASQLRHHPAWTAADLAAGLAGARDRLALMRAENLSVAAAFGLSYHDLTEGLRRLFRRLGLHPGPNFDAYAAAALDGTTLDVARRSLEDLYDQHLLAEPVPGRYQLHDLLREHARTLAAADDPPTPTPPPAGYWTTTCTPPWPPDSTSHQGRRLPPPAARQPAGAGPGHVHPRAGGRLAGGRAREPARRRGLRRPRALPACHRDTRRHERLPETRGHWDQSAALHHSALAVARQTGDRLGEADTLGKLGELQRETGDYPAAAASLAEALALYRELGDQSGQACILDQLGMLSTWTGDYPAAAASHQQALALFPDLGDLPRQAWALTGLGVVQQLTGDYPAAAAQLAAGPGAV